MKNNDPFSIHWKWICISKSTFKVAFGWCCIKWGALSGGIKKSVLVGVCLLKLKLSELSLAIESCPLSYRSLVCFDSNTNSKIIDINININVNAKNNSTLLASFFYKQLMILLWNWLFKNNTKQQELLFAKLALLNEPNLVPIKVHERITMETHFSFLKNSFIICWTWTRKRKWNLTNQRKQKYLLV